MSFHVGQRIVCVEAATFGEWNDAAIDAVYVVRDLVVCPVSNELGLRLQEIMLPPSGVPGAPEGAFRATRFRPVIERKTETGMAILRKLLKTNKVDA